MSDPQVDGYVFCMDDREDRKELAELIPGCGAPSGYFISAKHPGVDGDKIVAAGAKMKTKRAEDADLLFDQAPAAAFLAKCQTQITGFRVPILKGGLNQDLEYESKNYGDNRNNNEFYETLLKESKVRRIIEEWLDRVGGRTEEAQKDLAELGNA